MVSDTWPAGEIYSEGLLDAIRWTFKNKVDLVALEWYGIPLISEQIRRLVDEVISVPTVTRWTRTWVRERGANILLKRDHVASRFLESLGLDAITFGIFPRGCN